VLVACEFSGVVREAFRRRGHDAVSCDLAPALDGSPHHRQGDVLALLEDGWDLMIAHPDCTHHTRAGERWFYTIPARPRPGVYYGAARVEAMERDVAFFRRLWLAPIPRICIENPRPHRHSLERFGVHFHQVIQPYDFGHGETKTTCLWLKNLPPLMATARVAGRVARIHRESAGVKGGLSRRQRRSVTYPGIAEAMVDQWGDHRLAVTA